VTDQQCAVKCYARSVARVTDVVLQTRVAPGAKCVSCVESNYLHSALARRLMGAAEVSLNASHHVRARSKSNTPPKYGLCRPLAS
jgi:hypothetical protein